MLTATRHELERWTRQWHALAEVAKTLTAEVDLPTLLGTLTHTLADVLEPADSGAILLWDSSAGVLRAEVAFGYDLALLREARLRPGESITGKVYSAGAAQLHATPAEVAAAMADLTDANRASFERALGGPACPRSAVAAPLAVGERKLGVLVLETLRRPLEFTAADLPFVQALADLIALAIDRLQLEAESNAMRDAQEASRVRAEMMAMLSHELRTPLVAIKGYSTALLLDEVAWSAEKRHEFLSLIDQECDSLQVMISDILDAALIDVGHLTLERQPVRLPQLAGEVAEEMQLRTGHHTLVVHFPRDFPIVEADPYRLLQVIRNILDNAIKYSPDGGLIVIRGETRATAVVVSVSDQGMGISPEDMIPLFNKYFRVKLPPGYRVPGIGLGLPLARAIVEAHGGRIWVESQVGEGTTMHFSLPRADLNLAPGE